MSQAITKFKIEANDDSEPSYELGWNFLTTDLNKNAGGKFIYLGHQSIDGQPPITSEEATRNIQKALELSLADKLTLFLIAIGDPDDFIGFNSKFYVAGDSSVKKFLSGLNAPVECLEDKRDLELKFEGDGANYKVLWKSHALI